jgi:hypothetical protein
MYGTTKMMPITTGYSFGDVLLVPLLVRLTEQDRAVRLETPDKYQFAQPIGQELVVLLRNVEAGACIGQRPAKAFDETASDSTNDRTLLVPNNQLRFIH